MAGFDGASSVHNKPIARSIKFSEWQEAEKEYLRENNLANAESFSPPFSAPAPKSSINSEKTDNSLPEHESSFCDNQKDVKYSPYHILSKASLEELEAAVNAMLASGYRLIGSMQITGQYRETRYIQELVAESHWPRPQAK